MEKQRSDAASGLARTNNICEGWHHGLQSLFSCQHPTMWKFMDGILKDCNSNKSILLQAVTGTQQPRRKRYCELQERVERSLQTYTRINALTYLRGMAHLSQS